MTKAQLIQQIRFGLEQLKSTNNTMAFEHVCRFFARARIARNVIPATGPVQSGGDQGRDFETFHTYLSGSAIRNECALGYAAQPIAFPCSLEKNPLRKNGKLDSDVTTILSCGTPVERIYFFSGEDIPVASRHKKQQEVEARFGIKIEIIDAQALSEHLSDPDLFWIASQYLNIPNDFFPRKKEENWYEALLSAYKQRSIAGTYAEFADIKSALRHIYKDEELKVDLPFWLEKMQAFIGPDNVRDLNRKAIYEKFVAKLMGQNDISGLEGDIRDYYSDLADFLSPASFDDAQILLSFVRNSKYVIGSELTDEEIEDFSSQLWQLLLDELKGNISTSKRCSYMEIQANIILNRIEENSDGFNVGGYVSKIEEMLPKIKNAPFFALERLAGRIVDYISILLESGRDPAKMEALMEKVDAALALRKSDLSVGESIRDRALLYIEAGKITVAIGLLHQLKLKWFKSETTRGVILTAMMLADCYARLNMDYASKYYSLVAADMSVAYGDNEDVIDLFPQAIAKAADSAYLSGSWMHYLQLAELSLGSYHAIEKDYVVGSSHENLSAVYYPAIIKLVAQRSDTGLNDHVEGMMKRWGYIKDEIEATVAAIDANKDLYSDPKLLLALQRDMNGVPFNDIGLQRTICFKAYGSEWTLRFPNDAEANTAAEQFVTMLQVYLVELSNVELFLTRAKIAINIAVTADSKPSFNVLPDNREHIWEIRLPLNGGPVEDPGLIQVYYMGVIASILRNISLLPDAKMKDILDQKLSKGLLNAVKFGQAYHTLYASYINPESFDATRGLNLGNSMLASEFVLCDNEALPWETAQAETYSYEHNMSVIRSRVNQRDPFAITLVELKGDPSFTETIKELRTRWLDWQIYLAFGNIILNYKLAQDGIVSNDFYSSEAFRNAFMSAASRSEHAWYRKVPSDILSTAYMEGYLNHNMIASILPSYGLEFHSETPDTGAIKDVLVQRFNFMEDGKEILVF